MPAVTRFTLTGDNLVFMVDGSTYKVSRSDRNFGSVAKAINEGKYGQELLDIFNHGVNLKDLLNGSEVVTFDGSNVMVNGEVLHDNIVNRVRDIANAGLPLTPILKFIENVQQNPSFKSRKQLYDFLQYNELALTDDGHFVAYKAVKNDYWDKYTGRTHLNVVGAVIKMDRASIDDDSDVGCSQGLHVGAIQYVKSYGNNLDDRIMLCKINPKDVVSVPKDCTHQKCRVCEYLVLTEVTEPILVPLFTSDGKPYEVPTVEVEDFDGFDYEDDYDDDYDYDSDYDNEDEYDSEIDYEEDDDFDLPPQLKL